jgi:hypothetical protein
MPQRVMTQTPVRARFVPRLADLTRYNQASCIKGNESSH